VRDAYDVGSFDKLGDVRPLKGWEPSQRLRPSQMRRIAEQALSLLSGYYVHLPVKQRLYGADPIARLRVLRDRLEGLEPMDELEFHEELTAIFTSLRDSHTNYILPAPYRERIAFLPFLIERVTDGKTPRYLVTKIYPPIADSAFEGKGKKIAVTHWNGMPIDRAVELSAALNTGGNADARLARGLKRLTFRWLGIGLPPAEEWVTLTYRRGGSEYHARCPWLLIDRAEEPFEGLRALKRRREPVATARGLDAEGEWIRGIQRRLFAHSRDSKWKHNKPWSELLAWRRYDGYGYLRVFSFSLERVTIRQFEDAARRFLMKPCKGLIIDVRGNPGGDLRAVELLLRMLAGRPIESATLEFLNAPSAVAMARRFVTAFEGKANAHAWEAELRHAVAAGSTYVPSPGVPGPTWSGVSHEVPKVLLIDALSYSAADVFAAGFKDNKLGFVLGTAARTGGGGGNVWDYDVVRAYVGDSLTPRTAGAGFDIAVRRIVRSGRSAGVGLEDVGVEIDTETPFPVTVDDVLGDNEALLARAIDVLKRGRSE
jgi:C-terminal processing protease CtpA/Prc